MVSPELISVCGGSDLREISPMHPRRFDREMMMTVIAFGARADGVHLRRRAALARARQRMMAAQLRQRLLRPAALAGRGGGSRGALDLLLAEFARRKSEAMTERPAEMRGVVEAVAIGDFGDRMMRLRRARQIPPRFAAAGARADNA